MGKQTWTDEEKAGKKVADIISDLRLDAELVGESIGTSQPVEILNRLVKMIDGMYASRERFRRALGENPTDISKLPKIGEKFDGEYATSFVNRCLILSEIYLNYSDDARFEDLVSYADIAYPAAYMVENKIVEANNTVAGFIDEAWDALLDSLNVEDEGFESFEALVSFSEEEI